MGLMPNSAKRKLAAGAAGLVVLAGTGGAYAANQKSATPSTPADRVAQQKSFLDDVAKRLHVTSDQLTAAVKGAAEDQVDAAVAAGKLTKDQGDQVKKRIESAKGLPGLGGLGFGGPGRPGGPGGPGGPGPGPGGHRGFGGPFNALDGAATYLGLNDQQLREKLQSGKSLADVAKATSGKTVAGLEAAMKDALSKQLADQVKAGHLTQAQADKISSELTSHLDDIVNNTPPKGGPRAFKRHWP
jgi:polyhydroxyalkanoate synthesis regulator phasin